ncbi:MAG: hypothetical protein ACREQB_10535 [Candidatus Binataceae bacterium]
MSTLAIRWLERVQMHAPKRVLSQINDDRGRLLNVVDRLAPAKRQQAEAGRNLLSVGKSAS